MPVAIPNLAPESLKLSPRYVIAVSVAAALLFFLLIVWLTPFGLDVFSHTHRQWPGLAPIVSASIWGVAIASELWKLVIDTWIKSLAKR